jgi:hypothetical protein
MSEDQIENLRLELFKETGLKIDENDPLIQIYLLQNSLMNRSLLKFQRNLNDLGDAIILEIKEQQADILKSFDGKQEELYKTLAKLDNHKEAMVADVWLKLQQKLQKQIHEDMQAIANNANNKINNQRNMFIGGIIGLLIGLFILVIILFITK